MTVLPDESGLAYTMARKRDPYAGQRSFAQKLLAQGTDTSPIQSPWQGVGRLAQALVGGYGLYKADSDEKAAGTALAAKIAEAGKIADPTARMSAFAAIDPEIGLKYAAQSTAQEAATKRQRDDDLQAASFLIPGGTMQAGGRAGDAISGIESGGRYDAMGPVANAQGDRAHGKYQVMGANIGPWTQEILGKTMTPQEFLANPQAQDAVFKAKFAQYQQQYGSPEAAARAWFAGPGGMNNPNAKDVLGTTVQGYGNRFAQAYGPGATGSAPPGIAQGDNTGGNGSGVPVLQPGANFPQQGDPGAQYEAAARRAHEAGRGDIAIKYMQQATAAREAAQLRDANRTLQHVDLGDSIGILDPRSGQIVQRIPKGSKPGSGEGGAFGGTGMENQARSALVRAAQDPAFAASPAYAAAHNYLGKPRFDPSTQMMIPPEDLSRFPAPTYRANGQPQGAPPQAIQPGPQAGGSLDYGPTPSGMPPAPSPQGVAGPTLQAGAPPQAPGGIVATPVTGLPPKPPPENFRKLETEVRTVASALDNFQKVINEQNGGSLAAYINDPTSPSAQKISGAYQAMKTALRSEAFINTGVLQPGENKMLEDMLLSPESIRGYLATPDAYKAKLDQFRIFIDNKLKAAYESHGIPRPEGSSLAPTPRGGDYIGPDGRPVTMQAIEETARNRGMDPQAVIERLKLRAVR
jgi:hypothetical protein